jgi:histidine triad (HIT) family protein
MSIFAKIIAGQIPCHQVYRDDKVIAFLDINPVARGHTLVVPLEPAETLDALSDESAAAIGRVLPRISRAVLKATGAQAFNVLQNNGQAAHQAVFHVHFHIIPVLQGQLGIGWNTRQLQTEDGKKLAKAIASCI